MSSGSATYRIRVDRHLDDRWAAVFGGVAIRRDDDGTTLVIAPVADQAQLHGLLAALRDLDLTLVELTSRPTGREPTLDRPLHTERLRLRPATVDDTEATWAFRRLPEVNEWLTGTPDTLTGYRALFTRPDRLATTVVVELADGGVIGDLVFRREDAWAQREVADAARGRQAELGWVLDPRHRGHGYATEGVRALVRHALDELDVRRVTASAFLDDDASWRLMERVGMRREAHAVRESLHRSGRWLDTVTYALLADEPARGAGPPVG